MKAIIVQWPPACNGSRYTLHGVDSYSKSAIYWSIDSLGDPCETKHIRVETNRLEFLSDEQRDALECGYDLDLDSLEQPLSEIWQRRTCKKPRSKITSKYIKIKHHRWGCVDEHRAVMQDHLDRKLSSNEVVHHINGNTHDNRMENLELMSLSDHSRMHCKDGNWNTRMYGAGGLPKNSRFTHLEAENIRQCFKTCKCSMRSFALSLGLSPRIIEDLVKGHSYA
jgi:hypothetical protein